MCIQKVLMHAMLTIFKPQSNMKVEKKIKAKVLEKLKKEETQRKRYLAQF